MISLLFCSSDDSWINYLLGIPSEVDFDPMLIVDHLFLTAGFFLCLALVLRLLHSRRSPGATIAWLMAIVLIPYVGVPLYILLGGRKFRQMARRKQTLFDPSGDTRSGWSDSMRTIERVLSTAGMPPVRSGNQIEFLADGQTGYHALMSALEGATKSIHLMTFILKKDATGRAVIDLLARKAREGVEVRLLLDALGCLSTRGRFVNSIREAGGQVGIFMPVLPLCRKWSANLRNHRKIVIIDGQTAMLGGMNLAAEYMGPEPDPDRWLDTAATVRGPAVADLDAIFASDWNFATDQSLEPCNAPTSAAAGDEKGSLAQIAASGPDTLDDIVYESMFAAIFEAKERIWIVTPYFVPDEPLLRALKMQTRLGVDVRLIMPRRSNHLLADLARSRPLRELAAIGAGIFLCEQMVHAKLMLVDQTLAAIGSANFDQRSFYLNYEVQLFMYSESEIGATRQWMEQRIADSSEMGETRISLIRGWAEDVSALVAPLL